MPPHDIYTIGHSNHPLDMFLDLLRAHEIETVADVRTSPYSKYASHFDSPALKQALSEAGIGYVFLGKELGGRPTGSHYYDTDGRVFYDRVAEADFFAQGLERLRKGMKEYRIAMLCAEENPSVCHRRLLIARVLNDQGVSVGHIRGDGEIEDESALQAEEAAEHSQLSLFETAKPEWKSIPSVLPKKAPNDSSAS